MAKRQDLLLESEQEKKDATGLASLAESPSRWVRNQILTRPIIDGADGSPRADLAVALLLAAARVNKKFDSGEMLRPDELSPGVIDAACYDLLVSSSYFGSATSTDWHYCPDGDDALACYHFTNTCPRCALRKKFFFMAARKPHSATIGAQNARAIEMFLALRLKERCPEVQVYSASEPADLLVVDIAKRRAFLAEVKAAPLVTLPLATKVDRQSQTNRAGNVSPSPHIKFPLSHFSSDQIAFFLPIMGSDGDWGYRLIPFEPLGSTKQSDWAYSQIQKNIVERPDNFEDYLFFWSRVFVAYGKLNRAESGRDPIYAFMNSAGRPDPFPIDWPKTAGNVAFQTLSDGKSSVGMDRTDDLKKATAQVLFLGVAAKDSKAARGADDFSVVTGIVSNIHAVRHRDLYLEPAENVIWTRGHRAGKASELNPDQPLYNLFDGVITLTHSVIRDEWLYDIFG